MDVFKDTCIVRKPIRWYGGKSYLARRINRFFPEHKRYIEPFAGGAALLWVKKPCRDIEILNDKDKELFNFYNVLRDKELFAEFERMAQLVILDENLFLDCCDTLLTEGDCVKRAWKFWYIVNTCYGAKVGRNFGFVYRDKLYRFSIREHLAGFNKRLSGVQIMNRSFEWFFEKFDEPDVLMYLDPPYMLSTRQTKKDYKHELSNEQHMQLIELCIASKNQIIISGYSNELYEQLEVAGWQKFIFNTRSHMIAKYKGKADFVRQDCIWFNFKHSMVIEQELF